ncbi:hypothetical protein RUM43_005154 [Polyplax serrata]|uniref:UDP-glucuronosyltransferase n=1 Tax=Polyplax serrata TaxID=468196 RepID=A0AAN8XMM8_POLSC
MYEAYVQKLAERGHTVTLVAWHNLTKIHANIKSIGIGDNSGDSFHVNLAHYEATPKILQTWTELQVLNDAGQKSCQQGLTHPKIKALCESKQKFDLVVVEYFNTDCFAVLAHLFKAPLMGIFSSPPLPWHNDRMGNPDNPSYIVSVFSGFTSQMDFSSRIKNTIGLTFAKAYHKMYYTGPAEKLIKKNFGTGIPKLADIVSTTSVFLVNSHFSLLQSRPLVPGVVEVGGLHVQPPKKLPADLDKYLSQSKKGVVYFSLGTVTLATSMPPKKMRTLLNAFGNLTHDVLWRCEEEVPNKPKNMLLKTWLPQNDVLAHPNVKLFVTHGGLLGIMEAVTYGVPMIVLPIFGDQFHNGAAIAEKGAGIVLDYATITEAKFLQTLNKVLEDKSYADNAKLLSVKFKERPLTAMNSAIYWTEYVMKFKGAPHLRPANTKLSWFSECLLDVYIFLIAAVTLFAHLAKKAFLKYREFKKAQEESQMKKKKK